MKRHPRLLVLLSLLFLLPLALFGPSATGGGGQVYVVSFEQKNFNCPENITGGVYFVTVTVYPTPPSDVTVSVDFATIAGGSATPGPNFQTPGVDYIPTTGTLTFKGVGTKTFPISINNDDISEGDETICLALSNPSANATLTADPNSTVTIVDDEAPATVTFLQTPVSVEQGLQIAVSTNITPPNAENLFFYTTNPSIASVSPSTPLTVTGLFPGPTQIRVKQGTTLILPAFADVFVSQSDPAQSKVILQMDGVADDKKLDPGGYVSINANNDNGSDWLNTKPLSFGDPLVILPDLPKVPDYKVDKLPLAKDDPDLVKVTLAKQNLQEQDTIKIIVTKQAGAQGKIELWTSAKKDAKVDLTKDYPAKDLPDKIFVEGTREGAAEREIDLTVEVTRNKVKIFSDTVKITVTPVLNYIKAELGGGGDAPGGLVNEKLYGWSILSNKKDPTMPTMVVSISAQVGKINGRVRMIQNVMNVNNIGEKDKYGATRGEEKFKFDFAAPNAGKWLVDAYGEPVPFYNLKEKYTLDKMTGIATLTPNDSPIVPVDSTPSSIIPTADGKTTVDLKLDYKSYAVVHFADRSLYFFGKVTWSVDLNGEITPDGANYTFPALAKNKNTANAKPANFRTDEIGVFTAPYANGGKAGWSKLP